MSHLKIHDDENSRKIRLGQAIFPNGSGTITLGGRERIMIQSSVDGRLGAKGPVEGTMKINGKTLGSFATYPSDADPVSTDYVVFDPDGLGLEPGYQKITVDGIEVNGVRVQPATDRKQSDFLPKGSSPDDAPEGPEPSDVAGIVNADNSDGAALAPALRRRGVEVDDVGAAATFGGTEFEIVDEGVVSVGGDRFDVGDVTDSDEAARVISGPNTGAPVATDSDVVDDGGLDDGGLLGVGLLGLGLLGGVAVLLGGGE